MSHLRDSGALEQDANAVLLLHREKTDSSKGVVEIDVAKNRGGKTGIVKLDWNGNHVRFSEVAEPERGSELDTCDCDAIGSEPWSPDGEEEAVFTA